VKVVLQKKTMADQEIIQPITPAAQPTPATPAAPPIAEDIFKVPVNVPASMMNKLVAMSNETSSNISSLCLDLIQKSLNVELLSTGTINDFSDDAIDAIKTANLESVLEGLRIYNVAKSPVPAGDGCAELIVGENDIVFSTTSDVKDYIAQINAHRVKKGLAPLEKSICELLYHYGLTLGDYSICQDVTGIPYNKFVAVFKTLGLNEREQNGAQSNMIETGKMFNKFSIVDTPDAVLPEAKPAPDVNEKKATK
jgi:hypothetical protein